MDTIFTQGTIFHKLFFIELSYNQITQIDLEMILIRLMGIKHLYLNNNQLTNIEYPTQLNISRNNSVDLVVTDNPFICSLLDLVWLMQRKCSGYLNLQKIEDLFSRFPNLRVGPDNTDVYCLRLAFGKNVKMSVVNLNLMRCSAPAERKGLPVWRLDSERIIKGEDKDCSKTKATEQATELSQLRLACPRFLEL